jgi:small-conductance mechanosensitive channel
LNNAAFQWVTVRDRLLAEFMQWIGQLPFLLLALVVVWAAWAIGRWLSRRSMPSRVGARNPFLRELVRTTVRWAATGIGVLLALEILDATALVGALLGTAGIVGIALGFAFKETLENYVAGILMSLRQPFSPRDHVVIGGHEGLVVALTSRATILMSLDGNHLRLPNALVFSSVTLNYTRNPMRRFEFDVGIGVEEDLLLAQQLGVTELGTVPGVLAEPPPRGYIASLGDSNVQLRFQGWVDQRESEFLLVRSEAIRRVKLTLEDAGMDMPEPIYRVQLTERAPVRAELAPDRPKPATPPSPGRADRTPAVPIDTRAVRDVQLQIDADPRRGAGRDLLDAAAPRE